MRSHVSVLAALLTMLIFGPLAILRVLWDAARGWPAGRVAVGVIAVSAATTTSLYGWYRTTEIGPSPALSVEAVRITAQRIARATRHLGGEVTVLTPDIGGALWENRFRVVDLMGLIDRPLGRIVGRTPQARHDHLLHERRPEGIYVHGHWRSRAGLDRDRSFQETYAPVWEERPATDGSPTAGFDLRRNVVDSESNGRASGDSSRAGAPRGPN